MRPGGLAVVGLCAMCVSHETLGASLSQAIDRLEADVRAARGELNLLRKRIGQERVTARAELMEAERAVRTARHSVGCGCARLKQVGEFGDIADALPIGFALGLDFGLCAGTAILHPLPQLLGIHRPVFVAIASNDFIHSVLVGLNGVGVLRPIANPVQIRNPNTEARMNSEYRHPNP